VRRARCWSKYQSRNEMPTVSSCWPAWKTHWVSESGRKPEFSTLYQLVDYLILPDYIQPDG
jgi:hypothetical protein